MSAPVIEPAAPANGVPDSAVPIRLPIMVIEGLESSDGRYIEPGTLQARDLPMTLFAKTKGIHGSDGDTATSIVGAITEARRIPGPQARGYSGKTLPEGTFVWEGTGWLYKDVPAAPDKSAYDLVRDGALRGNSVDMTTVVAEFQGENGELADEHTYTRISMQSGIIAATTLCAIPAFADAYIELDGERLAPPPAEALVAAITAGETATAWTSAELGDECAPCAAGVEMVEHEHPEAIVAALAGEDAEPPAQDYSTSGMVALIPANPNMLIVPGGDPASELHLTLAYLGDRIDEWSPEQVAAVHQVARKATDPAYAEQLRREEAVARGQDHDDFDGTPYVSEAQKGPLTGGIFAHAVFNPNGDNGHDPATVYLLDGTGDRGAIEFLASTVQGDTMREVGDVLMPQQYQPWVPHITAGYNLTPDQLTYTGPVQFTHVRVVIGDNVTDYPLGGGEGTLVASAASLPPAAWFDDPKLDGPTALTVTDEGRVYGHIAEWGTCHTGFPGKCVTPPSSPSGYAYYLVHSTRALADDGTPVTIPVGYGTISRSPTQGGHAALTATGSEAAAHYDNTCLAAFELNVGEDAHGIWCAGRLMPGLDEGTEHRARGAVFSGDWRVYRGQRELIAALAVVTPGFPVPRTLVAAGEPLALVAAGIVHSEGGAPDGPFHDRQVLGVSEAEFASVVAWVNAQRLTAEQLAAAEELDRLADGLDLDDLSLTADAALTFALDSDHPWFDPALTDHGGSDTGNVTAAGRKTLPLPPYIKRIKKHLEQKGMSTSHAIASAVNAAKKMCSTGDLNFPGSQQVNAGSKAEACAAVAQWKADRPGAK